MDFSFAKLTEVYLKIKEERERLSAEYREADGKLVSKQENKKCPTRLSERERHQKCQTDAGTFYRTVRQKYWTSDWDSMREFIFEHEVPEFLDKRLNQKNVREFLEETQILPKGLNVDAEYALTIRKA